MDAEIIAMIISLFAMAANILSFQMSKKAYLLLFQLACVTLFLLSFLFAGGGIGVIINAICLVRCVLFMVLREKTGKLIYITVAGLTLACILGYLFYVFVWMPNQPLANKLWSIFPVIGAIIGNVAFSLKNLNYVRMIKIGDSICWLFYNFYIGWGALGGILCESFALCSILIGIIRFRKISKKKEETKDI